MAMRREFLSRRHRFPGASAIVGWCWLGLLAVAISGCPSPRQSLPDAAEFDAKDAAGLPDLGATAGFSGAGGGAASGGAMAGTGGSAGEMADASTSDAGDAPQSIDAAANGGACSFDTDCRFGHCVEGVCCESSCAAKCTSCRSTNTGMPDGKCAAVKAGVPHGTDCTTSDATTCGLDGKCDGAGACRNWASGTACAAELCTDGAGASNYASARSCDGAGTCKAAATTSTCGGTFDCAGTKCRTTCAASTDCIAAAYCASNTCVRKKTDGTVCAADTECLNGVCGGRCCAAGCSCTQPNPTNLLKNPGFDTDTSGWTIDAGAGTLVRVSADAEGCLYSGAMLADIEKSFSQFYQCVPNVHLDGLYTFGIKMMDASAICGVRFYAGVNCDGNEVIDDELNAPLSVSGWQSPASEGLGPNVSVSGANSVLFFCNGSGTFDLAYISPAPAQY
jgi:hypothetical protein